jgi:hypothetical protein
MVVSFVCPFVEHADILAWIGATRIDPDQVFEKRFCDRRASPKLELGVESAACPTCPLSRRCGRIYDILRRGYISSNFGIPPSKSKSGSVSKSRKGKGFDPDFDSDSDLDPAAWS